jgi:hypothetical protein
VGKLIMHHLRAAEVLAEQEARIELSGSGR